MFFPRYTILGPEINAKAVLVSFEWRFVSVAGTCTCNHTLYAQCDVVVEGSNSRAFKPDALANKSENSRFVLLVFLQTSL